MVVQYVRWAVRHFNIIIYPQNLLNLDLKLSQMLGCTLTLMSCSHVLCKNTLYSKINLIQKIYYTTLLGACTCASLGFCLLIRTYNNYSQSSQKIYESLKWSMNSLNGISCRYSLSFWLHSHQYISITISLSHILIGY